MVVTIGLLEPVFTQHPTMVDLIMEIIWSVSSQVLRVALLDQQSCTVIADMYNSVA